ncbi:MAG: recombination protein NinB [Candidatus Ochrobactrum gambitense]|nr:MAG: recombination protein NinB [Candidatus Ochrobactrum gambitense]WEK17188.1 MAG: recombination protein NinB [Candidatus Ochrobactrum gambitense]
MEKQRFILVSPRIRQNAVQALFATPDGFTATFAPPTRSVDQNAMFHAICTDIAKSGYEWAGEPRKPAEWKVLLVSGHAVATNQKVEIVPGLEGEFINIRESTARMSVARASSLIEYALAWCADHGITLHDTRRQGFLQEQAA